MKRTVHMNIETTSTNACSTKSLHSVALVLYAAAVCSGQTLPDTQPLTLSGDPVAQMVSGIGDLLLRQTAAAPAHRKPSRERLRYIVGAVDERVPFDAPELAKISETADYAVYAARWPVLDGVTGEGLLYQPKRDAGVRMIALPDADQSPEDLEIARRRAAQGTTVLVPVLIDRKNTWSGNPKFRMTNQPHREFLYRMTFPVGRTISGYEVEKVLAAVDWYAHRPGRIEVWGYGEGGLVALYAAALDPRIEVATVSGYFQPREELWKEPIYRNVWSLLRDFGDAELAAMCRKLVVEPAPGPTVNGPDESDPKRRGAAPGVLAPAAKEAVQREVERARRLGARIELADARPPDAATSRNPERMHRQFRELVDYTQRLVRESARVRDAYWSKADFSSPDRWVESTKSYRNRIWGDVIGHLPAPTGPANPRTRLAYRGDKWNGYEVTLDLYPGVFAYGVLLVPKDLRPGERRPVVVCQHGLDGRPQDLFAQPESARGFRYYQNIGSRLADMGFITYMPQNPYTGDFRPLQRKANPLGYSIFSFILAQNERLLDWLSGLAFVDPKRIGFYGLSYGGKTALRIPTLLDRYALSICSGDFNEWIVKLATVDAPWSYMFTQEYEMGEYNLGGVANHAELARLMAPRPFMVERGHRDGVGVDEWIAFEYAKVQRFYDEMGLGERARIEFFNGPHMIHGVGTVEFLKKYLNWP